MSAESPDNGRDDDSEWHNVEHGLRLRRGAPPDRLWKPGQSGNPKGRPRGVRATDELRRLAALTVWEKVPLPPGETVLTLAMISITSLGSRNEQESQPQNEIGTPEGTTRATRHP